VASCRVLLRTPPSTSTRSSSSYSLLLTTDPGHVRDAQRLRHRVFAEEFGARLAGPEPGLDVDRFDAFCDHLVVRDDVHGEIGGTYRLLPPSGARDAGGLYADDEFDLSALDPIRPEMVETGRSCVDPGHRSGAVVGLVWAGLVRYLLLTGNRWLVGCASVSLADGGSVAAGVWQRVLDRHLAPAPYRVRPLRPWDAPPAPGGGAVAMPPLLRGYLRSGAWVCGPPADDPDFGCADFPVLLGIDHLDARYARHFLGAEP
jgi:putative hemolysin